METQKSSGDALASSEWSFASAIDLSAALKAKKINAVCAPRRLMSRFSYTHYPNSRDGYDYSFIEVAQRNSQDVYDWCVVQYGEPDGIRRDGGKKWMAGSWSFMFTQESDALWFKMWFC
jgi:hypothetical protein